VALNPHLLAGSTALVVALLLLLVYFYRRRIFIAWWMAAWLLQGVSMLAVSRPYPTEQLSGLVYGVSQFLGVLSALAFVVAADAYRQRPRFKRGHGLILLGIAIYFVFMPVALGRESVRALGHVVIAGGMLTAAGAHFLLLRQARFLGATIIGIALLGLAGFNFWLAAIATGPNPDAVTPPLVAMTVLFLVGALGQQLLAFEDMTYELQRTNRRLETAQDELRQLVITDPLTGMRNRRFFHEIIGRELQRHRRYETPLSIVFIDIDRFKAINDTLGHETGDRVLREVAGFLLKNIREADYVFRWGGDEFLVLLSCREAAARTRALALQTAFARSPQVADLPPGVALSIGCVEVPADTTDVMSLIQAADEKMYADKKRRR
jgi:diguanylate cyclase (GGDEF)-like protein